MKLLHNILVPVDINPSFTHAIKYAASISETFNLHLILLHIISAETLSLQSEVMLKETVREKYDALRSEIGPAVAERMELVDDKIECRFDSHAGVDGN